MLGFVSYEASAQDELLKPLPDFLQAAPENVPPPLPEETVEGVAAQETEKPSALETLLKPKTDSIDTPPEAANRDDLKDIPDEYIEEALAFGDSCAVNRQMQLYFDCRCMAVKYLDRRIAAGPDAAPSSIQVGIGAECADGTGISGRMFESCRSNYASVPKGKDPEKFCACYGNTYAKLYENYGRPIRSRQHVSFMAQSRTACVDVRAARQLYGNNPMFPKTID